MIQEQSNTKRFSFQSKTVSYTLTVEVDIDALVAAYTGGDTSPKGSENASIQLYDLPATDELILFECGWLSSSGIHVKDIQEVEE